MSDLRVQTALRENDAFRTAAQTLVETKRRLDCERATITWHAMLVRPGSPDQNEHVDSNGRNKCYYTFIIPLTSPLEAAAVLSRNGIDVPSLGGAVLFGGNAQGLGQPLGVGAGVLYAAVHTGKDPNE